LKRTIRKRFASEVASDQNDAELKTSFFLLIATQDFLAALDTLGVLPAAFVLTNA
jgi:hypothetical protein